MTKAKAGGEQPVEIPDTLPILPLRNSVLFPGSIIPIDVGRKKVGPARRGGDLEGAAGHRHRHAEGRAHRGSRAPATSTWSAARRGS